MQIVVPMSGEGKRFREAGYQSPKPLIEVDGRPMIAHVIAMFPGNHDFKFICNRWHLSETGMRDVLAHYCPHGEILQIEEHKLGPVYAVDQIRDCLSNEPTIVSYCDYYAMWDFAKFSTYVTTAACDGCILCYRGFHPHLLLPNLYAGVRVDNNNEMLEIREKYSFTENKMDCWQSSGTYYFGSGELVSKYFRLLLDEKVTCKNEYYVSLVYNLLKRDRLKVTVFEQEYFCQWGTPQDLEIYKYWSNCFSRMKQEG